MPAIGVITLELRLDEAHSLKDNRHYVKSLKDRLRTKFNVGVAEIDHQDLWQRGLVACVTVSPNQAFAEQVLQALLGDSVRGGGQPLLRNFFRVVQRISGVFDRNASFVGQRDRLS